MYTEEGLHEIGKKTDIAIWFVSAIYIAIYKHTANFTKYSTCNVLFMYRHTGNFDHFGHFKSLSSSKQPPLPL